MKKLTMNDIIKVMMLTSYVEIQRYQKLIDEWDEPKDVAQRAAVLLIEVHKVYGYFAFLVYKNIKRKKT